jgi:hypothetical protein
VENMSKRKTNGAAAGSGGVTSSGVYLGLRCQILFLPRWSGWTDGTALQVSLCRLLIKSLFLLCCTLFLVCTWIVHADLRP